MEGISLTAPVYYVLVRAVNTVSEVAGDGYRDSGFIYSSIAALVILIIVGFFYVLRLVQYFRSSIAFYRKLPPGPLENYIPVYGYLCTPKKVPIHEEWTQLADVYGSVFRIQMGKEIMMIVTEPTLLKKVFGDEAVSGRPNMALLDAVIERKGLIAASGELWRSQRNFVIRCFRRLGFYGAASGTSPPKIQFEVKANEIVDTLMDEIAQHEGKDFNPEQVFVHTNANLVCTMIGKSFPIGDERLQKEIDGIRDSFKLVEIVASANFLPFMSHLPGTKRKIDILKSRRDDTVEFFRPFVEEHKELLDEDNPDKDLVDEFLLNQQTDTSSFYSDSQLYALLADIFSAGVENPHIILRWLFLALAKDPVLQETLHAELDRVIGTDRLPCLSDKSRMPMMDAAIMEALRVGSVTPIGVPRLVVKDVEIGDYFFPKGAQVVGLFWKFNRDPQIYKNANGFDPMHFIRNGSCVRPQSFMPFSVGQRLCPGADLTISELFLVTCRILQWFRVCPPHDGILPSFEEVDAGAMVRAPKPYTIRFVQREH